MDLTSESRQYVRLAANETDSQKRDCYICRVNLISDGAKIASHLPPVGLLASLLVGTETRCPKEGQRDE